MSGGTYKFSDLVIDHLVSIGYTHCFFLPGGNIMHLLDSARSRVECVAFAHEHSATLAAEYFNRVSSEQRAFALVTAGPGLSNAVTAIAGAFLENRDLLVIGGQVKSADLATGGLRQRGIQELDGVSIVGPITQATDRIETPVTRQTLQEFLRRKKNSQAGPRFLEICLDAQGAPVKMEPEVREPSPNDAETMQSSLVDEIVEMLGASERPVLLIGGGLEGCRDELSDAVSRIGVPAMTTYNGSDLLPMTHPSHFGRPNTWGMRFSNILLGQCDLLVALGTRLGLQQTGFNWQEWAPHALVVQVDRESAELEKGHPRVDLGIAADANSVLRQLVSRSTEYKADRSPWWELARRCRDGLPLEDSSNTQHDGFHNPYRFLSQLSAVTPEGSNVIPSSSGGAFTAFYQAFRNRPKQRIVSNKSLASMGCGLAGAIGAALARPGQITVTVEGDGSFLQNAQELATIAVRKLPIKCFIWDNNGYASIRMTQKNYFAGQYLGCDTETGLGFPDWILFAKSFGIEASVLEPNFHESQNFKRSFLSNAPHLFVVPIHPEQTFFPKISSRVSRSGSMESEPLWNIGPELGSAEKVAFMPHLLDHVFKGSSKTGKG